MKSRIPFLKYIIIGNILIVSMVVKVPAMYEQRSSVEADFEVLSILFASF